MAVRSEGQACAGLFWYYGIVYASALFRTRVTRVASQLCRHSGDRDRVHKLGLRTCEHVSITSAVCTWKRQSDWTAICWLLFALRIPHRSTSEHIGSAQAQHHVVLRPRSSYTVLACASKPLALAHHAKRVPPVCACAIMAVNVVTSISCTSLESWRDTQSGWRPAQTRAPLTATLSSEQDYSTSDMRCSCRARCHCAFVCCVAAASQIMHARTGSDIQFFFTQRYTPGRHRLVEKSLRNGAYSTVTARRVALTASLVSRKYSVHRGTPVKRCMLTSMLTCMLTCYADAG